MNAGSPDNPVNPALGELKSPEAPFLQVLAHRSMLKAYIMAIVRDPHLAEDTLSDVTVVVSRVWANYDPAQPFGPWARGIARRVALTNLRKWRRPVATLDEDMLDALGEEMSRMGDEGDQEEAKQKLQICLQKLPASSRELVQWRYYDEASYEEISRRTGRTMNALYMAFSRIHGMLGRCVKKGPVIL
jgi:RNA polymerase sigma-70 factor, ECF subfamily